MAKKVEVFNGEINEFVDWITGINELTGENVTANHPVSGKSIRDLLQNRLKAPIYFHYDENNSLYRLFASKEAYTTWTTDEEKYASLELGNFVAPSPFTATLTGLSEDTKYVRYGDNLNTQLAFRWNIEGKNQSNYSDSITVTYSFNNNGILTIPIKYTHNQLNVTFDMAPYLQVGTNSVTVALLGDTTNASISVSFNVEVLDLKLSSPFSIYTPVDISAKQLEVGYTVEGSGIYGRTVDFYIDGNSTNYYQEHINSTENIYSSTKQIPVRLSTGKHTLQMISYVTINNINYYSNLLYFEFVVEGFDNLDEKLITISQSFDKISNIFTGTESIKLNATLYEDFYLNWGFYTSDMFHTSQQVDWVSYCKNVNGDWEETPITTVVAKQNTKNTPITYTAVYYGQLYLRAYINGVKVAEYDLYVHLNGNSIMETEGFVFKLSAKGRSNTEPIDKRSAWQYTFDDGINDPITYKSTFHNFIWNQTSGWYNNALVLSNGTSLDIHIDPLSEQVSGLLTADDTTGFAYEIEFETFNIDNPNEVIISLGNISGASIQITPNSAFITNTTGTLRIKTNFKEGEKVKLVFILNSSNSADRKLLYIVNNGVLERGILVPGESFNASGEIHINGHNTGIKLYSMRLYNRSVSYNEAFANYVLDSGEITRLLTKNNVYDSNGNISETLCEQKLDTILITGPLQTVIGALDKRAEAKVNIERICLADLKYSFKIKNGRIRRHGQSTLNYPIPNFKFWSDSYDDSVMYDSKGAIIYKGRYQFKDGAIPSKKWVLQANYADSSGVHNGGLQRLIQDSWHEAKIDQEYKLRTPPQQYATSTGEFAGNGWREQMKCDFPYLIRISPDSFPCVVFWRKDESASFEFLGQYVFMDDKKSDYVYGERSIYNKADDPFRLKGDAPKKDDMIRLWDNSKTMKIEVLAVNTPYVNYTTNEGWDRILPSDSSDSSRSWMFNWENNFELIYPEPDDIYNLGEKDQKDLNDTSILKDRVLPFSDWIQWLVDCYNHYLKTGNYSKFRAEAADHLDLYKLAAYYIFVLRFGLVDSLQRNAEIKTYDSVHFWYEPWDMDIALGNKNTGGIAFDPPIDRNTQDPHNPGTFWISGKNGIPGTPGFTSCFLWDALEAWTTLKDDSGQTTVKGWIDNIVPTVSNALYAAGLSYQNVMDMFDNQYADKWCERMYNDSGHYKYVENGDGDYLQYLLGARTSHRHWWTKTSFDYWDAKWASGDFRTNSITIITNTTQTGLKIKIIPSTSTYFSFYNGTTGAIEATTDLTQKDVPVEFTMQNVLSTKDPRQIFGSLYIKDLDISSVAQYLERLNLSGFYNETTGTNIESLNIGMPWQEMVNGKFNYKNIVVTNYKDLSKLSSLYVRGFRNVTSFIALISPLYNLQNFYAAGSGLTQFQASEIGNQFNHIELPDTVSEFSLRDSLWQDLNFYHTSLEEGTHMEGSGEYDENGNEIMIEVPNTRLNPTPINGLPEALTKVEFLGNTGQNDCTREFVLTWVRGLKERDDFTGKQLVIEDVNWKTIDGHGGLSYNDLMDIARIPNLTLKGYIKLNDKNPTSDQLSNIMLKFGEGVFSLGSADLTIDYEQNAIIISAPYPCYTDDEGNIYLKEGNYYDDKGNKKSSVKLQASVFTLLDVDRIQKWGIANYGSTQWSSIAQRVSINQATGEITAPETLLDARKVRIIVQDSTDKTNVRAQYLTLNIAKRIYPASVRIILDDSKIVDNKYQIGRNGEYTFYPKFYNELGEEAEFDGTISSYEWSFTNENDKISVKNNELNNRECTFLFLDLQAFTFYEDLSLTVNFVNGYSVNVTQGIALMESIAVLEDDAFGNKELFKVVSMAHDEDGNQLYTPEGSSYYSSTLAAFNGKFDLSQYEIDNNAEPEPYYHKDRVYRLRSTETRDSNNILLFLTNIRDLDISNFPSLNEVYFNDTRYDDSSGEEVMLDTALGDRWAATWFEKVNISNNVNLTKVEPYPIVNLQEFIADNCVKLQEIDFSRNENISKISLLDSNVNLTIQSDVQRNINEIRVGSPSSITLSNVNANEISMQDYHNVQNMQIENCSENVAKLATDVLNNYEFTDEAVKNQLSQYKNSSGGITSSDLDSVTELTASSLSSEDFTLCTNLNRIVFRNNVKNVTMRGIDDCYFEAGFIRPDILDVLDVSLYIAQDVLKLLYY